MGGPAPTAAPPTIPPPTPAPTLEPTEIPTPLPVYFYVAPDGNDAWSGLLISPNKKETDGPFKTIQRAQAAVREFIVEGMKSTVEVRLESGNYYLDRPVTFDERDSGRNGYQVVYRNLPGETPVIIGGKPVIEWRRYQNHIYVASLEPDLNFYALYENGERAVQARYPNTEYLQAQYTEGGDQYLTLGFQPNNFPQLDSAAGLTVYIWPAGPAGDRNWTAQYIPVSKLDYENRQATLQTPAIYQIRNGGSRYFLQGSLSFLDQPGEFYLDTNSHQLYYWPRHDNIEQQQIIAPQVDQVISVVGSDTDHLAENIRFEGLTLTGSGFDEPQGGNSAAGVYLGNARSIQIKDCHIYGVGGSGIAMLGLVDHALIENNLIHDVGIHGIWMQTTTPTSGYVNRLNTLSGNYIHHIGQLIGHSAGIYVVNSGENHIDHNLIHDTPRYGISLKGVPPSSLIGLSDGAVPITEANVTEYLYTRQNVVEFNDVSRANLDSQDTGVIETWGLGPTNNIIQNNLIHDSDIPFSFGYGLYADDASDQIIIRNNIVHSLQSTTHGILQSPILVKGNDGQIINNVVANNSATASDLQSLAYGEFPSKNLVIERNIFFDNGTDTIYSFLNWTENRFERADFNLFFHTSDQYLVDFENPYPLTTPPDDLTGWLALDNGRYDQNSVKTDPLFVDSSQDDYRVQFESPALRLGFRNINVPDIGLPADFPFANSSDPLDRLFVLADKSGFEPWVELAPGETAQLHLFGRTLTGYVFDFSRAAITFQSADSQVATVDEQGLVTSKTIGVVRIVALALEGKTINTAYIDVIVNPRQKDSP